MGRTSRVAVVTGGSGGVGRAVVRELASRGFDVAVLARGAAGLAGAVDDVESAGNRGLGLEVDVADWDAVDDAAGQVEAELGPIDVWVNNAMVSVFSPVREMTPDDYHRVTAVTYLGYVHGTLAALRRMLPRDRGVIIQVGSALAYRGIPLQSAYCAAKHAIQGFNDSLRCELLHDGSRVRVTDVHIPAVNTPHFRWVKSRLPYRAQPVPPIHQPELAAEAILQAIDRGGREVWVGWPTVKAIVGNRLAPWYGDHYLAKHGVESQQIPGQPEDPRRAHNLYEPLDEVRDFGAHGAFDARAAESTSQLWFARHRWRLLGGGLGALAGARLFAARR